MTTNISTIPSNLPFLDTLSMQLLEQYGHDPIAFSNITIFLPSRRACKELAEAFLRASNGKPMLLPQIQPLGDLDDDELAFRSIHEEIPNVISSTRQRLILTQLIEKWQNHPDKEEKITIPQAAHLAIELASFLGEVEKEQLSFDEIEKIVPDELSRHWQVTLNFLSILIEKWPEILEDNKAVDIHTHRNISLRLQTQYWQKNPSEYPVIAAGSTGSIPATAGLLKVISQMPKGQVILPGLDTIMGTKSWEKLEQTHPQYGMKKLLEHIGIERDNIPDYIKSNTSLVNRNRLISEIMRPAATSVNWNKIENITADDLSGIELITAPSLQDEATIIAMKMKEVLHTPQKTAALITHQRDLAKRVSAILLKWDIQIDDSAGCELNNTPQAVYLRLLAQMVADNAASPISVLNCLKNPYATCGQNPKTFRDNVRKLELACMRGVRKSDGFAGFYKSIDSNLTAWLKEIESTLAPFLKLMSLQQVPFDEMLKKHLSVAEKLSATDSEQGQDRLWRGAAGEQLKDFIDELLMSSKNFKEIDPTDYAGLLDALLTGQTYRPPFGTHPRLYILSPIEARMLRFDLIILGELNEGSWPMSGKADPWMSRPMRDNFGLPLPEKKIGQSAHDFVQLLSSPNVVITRSEKMGGTQTIPSRWLLRLDAVLNILGLQDTIAPQKPWGKWAELLNKPDSVQPITAPAPNPPIDARPRKLSATNIEKLMRDPYWIYANKILRLKKLDDIDKDPGAMEFGNFVHNALEIFVKKYDEIEADNRYIFMLECGRQILKEQNLKPAVTSFWWPRFERISAWFVQNEESRRREGVKILSEIEGKYELEVAGGVFTLYARADRFEIDASGNIAIIDYKTGSPPEKKDVKLGISPQMTIEAIIANNNGFEKSGNVTSLEYWKLSGGQKDVEIKTAGYSKPTELEELIEEAASGVTNLINAICYDNTPLQATPNADSELKYNDYEHLERVKEWGE